MMRVLMYFSLCAMTALFVVASGFSFSYVHGGSFSLHDTYIYSLHITRNVQLTCFHTMYCVVPPCRLSRYSAVGFLEKNRDSVAPSVLELFERSTNPLVRLLFGPDAVWSAQQFNNLATEILGEGINKAEHEARNRSRLESQSTSEADDALAMANTVMKSSRRGQSMRKSRRTIRGNQSKKAGSRMSSQKPSKMAEGKVCLLCVSVFLSVSPGFVLPRFFARPCAAHCSIYAAPAFFTPHLFIGHYTQHTRRFRRVLAARSSFSGIEEASHGQQALQGLAR